MKGRSEVKLRQCRYCKVRYTGSRSYCSRKCESSWKYHNTEIIGEKLARMHEITDILCAMTLTEENAMPWERKELQCRRKELQNEYELLAHDVNG